jgi:hypothetical protein
VEPIGLPSFGAKSTAPGGAQIDMGGDAPPPPPMPGNQVPRGPNRNRMRVPGGGRPPVDQVE